MDIDRALIWGDDDECEVFAKVRSGGLCLLFRYSLDLKRPESLLSRMVSSWNPSMARRQPMQPVGAAAQQDPQGEDSAQNHTDDDAGFRRVAQLIIPCCVKPPVELVVGS